MESSAASVGAQVCGELMFFRGREELDDFGCASVWRAGVFRGWEELELVFLGVGRSWTVWVRKSAKL